MSLVRHTFVNPHADGPDATIVRPSNWNADHLVQLDEADIPDGIARDTDLAYHHVQAVPATVWTVDHNLGRHPAVTVLDSAGAQVEVDVDHVTTNRVVLILSYAVSGTADCS